MKKGKDVSCKFPGLYLVHQNIPGSVKSQVHLDSHLLFIPLQGEIAITVGSETLSLGQGKMLYLLPKTLHSFSSSSHQGERLIALIDMKMWKKKKGKAFQPSVLPLSQLTKELLFYLLLNPKSKNSDSIVGVLIETLSESLEHLSHGTQVASMEHLESKVLDFRVMAALEYMKMHFSEELSMSHVAKASGLSVRSLNRLLFQETGLSPRHLLIRYRIARATELLASHEQNVTQVALEVGYNSLSQFIASFRSVTGQLPSEFGKMANDQRK